jgi:branched-chain amino acid transport system permease protein
VAYFLEQLLNGLSLGCIYAFIALGYTMVYGIIKLINFAHGEFFMVGAFLGFFVLTGGGLEQLPLAHPWPTLIAGVAALVVAGVGAGVLAVITERLAYRPLQGSSRIAALLTALGVSLLLQNLGIQAFTAEQKGFPEPRRFVAMEQVAAHEGEVFSGSAYVLFEVESFSGDLSEVRQIITPRGEPFEAAAVAEYAGRRWHGEPIAGVFIDQPIETTTQKLLIIAALIASFGLLWQLVHRTAMGRAMRAVSYNPEAARLMGISSGRVISSTFFIGAFLAGVGGVIWGVRYGKVEPFMGFLPGLKAFIAAVIGGIGSLPGAVLGGLSLGVLEAMIPAYLPSAYTGYKDAAAFVALILILLVRPAGLLGRFEGEKV